MPRFEEYTYTVKNIPFVLRTDLIRTPLSYAKVSNWHEDIELEYFKEGEGVVLLDGKEYFVQAGDFIFVRSNVIHQLIPHSNIKYSCLIVDSAFCQNIGFSQNVTAHFHNAELSALFSQLETFHANSDDPCIVMKLRCNLLNQFIILNERCVSTMEKPTIGTSLATQKTKEAILYIRKNFSEKLTLDKIASELFISKFLLSRRFKEITHTTVIEYINNYRCKIAAEKILNGASVSEAAFSCGYENMSYFTKTFKKYFNCAPSQLKHTK